MQTKTRKNWTTKAIEALEPRDKRYSVTIGGGLSLKVQVSGNKSWVYRQCINGRVIDVLLGHYPEMSLGEAKQEARRRRKDCGLEPMNGYTFSDAFKIWCGLKKGRLVNYRDEKRRLEKYVISKIGRRQIDEITAPLIISVVRPIDDAGKKATLKLVLMRANEIMDYAVCAGYIQHNPLSKVSRVFAPAKTIPMPSMPWESLVSVMNVIGKMDAKTQLLFLWQLVTMLRPRESVSVRWSWIDWEKRCLVMPDWVMKKRREFRVPLTRFAIGILKVARKAYGKPRSDVVFCGRESGEPISAQTLAKKLSESELSGKLVAHGLRAIGRTWLADRGVRFEVAEACLSHVVGSTTARAYLRGDYFEDRVAVMESWSGYVENCVGRSEMKGVLELILKEEID